ncbi:hypothetical protein ACXHQ0_16220 [Vibrio antiquarius]|uniref:Uncharacterized protein n=3 Tax=Vibrio TaxID=662 RepID=A0A3E1IEC5_VIBPH|nr:MULTISPECIES: hypothetical protein [Vibrio]EJG0765001.1 hypothetical protein [Vibrio parahaemolyticus O5:K30]EQM48621.1 hypothetical protein D051_0851 [Vibrio parahaemolyticus VPCR-2010]MCA2474657.1 hypothetical protein [Vibrio alginolyticus]TVN04761.1 hypothetical protein FPV63_11200 [Vibrio cholerae]ARN69244.1 hypothetical protein FORC36_4727 [Vibrio vulnificus]
MKSNALLINEDDIGIVLVSLDVELEQENIEAAFDEIDYDRLYGDLEEYSRKSVSQQRVMAHELIKKQILQAQIF